MSTKKKISGFEKLLFVCLMLLALVPIGYRMLNFDSETFKQTTEQTQHRENSPQRDWLYGSGILPLLIFFLYLMLRKQQMVTELEKLESRINKGRQFHKFLLADRKDIVYVSYDDVRNPTKYNRNVLTLISGEVAVRVRVIFHPQADSMYIIQGMWYQKGKNKPVSKFVGTLKYYLPKEGERNSWQYQRLEYNQEIGRFAGYALVAWIQDEEVRFDLLPESQTQLVARRRK